jgi:hypothetical protein
MALRYPDRTFLAERHLARGGGVERPGDNAAWWRERTWIVLGGTGCHAAIAGGHADLG